MLRAEDSPTARDSARVLWFKRYPATQTVAAFLLAALAAAALSIDPTASSYRAIMKIDPTATGALYICYEVLLSFTGHADAVLYLALACLLTFPMRYVLFGRRERLRASVVLPALAFAACMVFGRSYDLTNSADLAVGGVSRVIESLVAGAGWVLLAYMAVRLLFECFDWFGAHRLRFTEARFGRLWRAADLVLNQHPFAVPLVVVVLAWLPTFIGCMPGLFMGDTGAQIRQWFNLPNGTSNYLDLINPNVLLNAHHPVAHTALVGSCVQLGMTLFGDENTGLLIYTALQFSLTALTVAYLVSSLRRFGVGLIPRAVVLGFFVFMPLFSNYAVLITKDVLFGDAVALLVVQLAKLLVPGAGVRAVTDDAQAGRAAVPAPAAEPALDIELSPATGMRLTALPLMVPFGARDWVLLVLASLGCTFFRNGGLVFPLVAAALAIVCQLADARRAVRAGTGGCRKLWLGVGAVALVSLLLYMCFTKVLMPAFDITPGSRREVLSVPFQQTARFVQKHDGAHAGITDGTGTADGLVTDEERAAIDAVLGYSDLAARYDPDKSDAVKNKFNEHATAGQLAAYFKVWAQMFVRDPESYLSAAINNYYGYFYPSSKDVFTYSTATSAATMDRPQNRAYFNFHPSSGPLVVACDHLVTLYRVAIQRIPLSSLALSSSTYVWLLIISCVYLLRCRQWRSLALFVPLLGILAVCLIGPCNGSTYMRYLYPMILALPFAVPVALVWPRRLWVRRLGG